MRYLTSTLALGALAIPGAAVAQTSPTGSAYVGVEGGYAFGSDLELATDATRDDPGLIFLTDGYDLAVQAGYDFGDFRLEAEYGHRDIGLDGSQAPQNDPFGMGMVFVSDGSLKHDRVMLNAYADFGRDGGVQGFVGAGAGIAWSELYVLNQPFTIPVFDDTDSSLAWQLMAGARFPLGSDIEASLKYRYLQVQGAGFTDFFGNDLDDDHATSSISLGVAYRF